MGKVIVGFTKSLDGFINGQNGSVERLYPDLDTFRYAKPLQESIEKTGAVVMGRKTFAMRDPDSYAGNYEYQVPIRGRISVLSRGWPGVSLVFSGLPQQRPDLHLQVHQSRLRLDRPRRHPDRPREDAHRAPLQRAHLGSHRRQHRPQRRHAGQALPAEEPGCRSLVGATRPRAVQTIRESDLHSQNRHLRRTSPFRQTVRCTPRGRSAARELLRYLSVLRAQVANLFTAARHLYFPPLQSFPSYDRASRPPPVPSLSQERRSRSIGFVLQFRDPVHFPNPTCAARQGGFVNGFVKNAPHLPNL